MPDYSVEEMKIAEMLTSLEVMKLKFDKLALDEGKADPLFSVCIAIDNLKKLKEDIHKI